MIKLLLALTLLQGQPLRTIAIDERLADDARISIGDKLVVSTKPGARDGDTVVVSGIIKRTADPSDIARSEYVVRMHLDQLQKVAGYGDRVDKFAVATRGGAATSRRRSSTLSSMMQSRKIALATIVITPIAL